MKMNAILVVGVMAVSFATRAANTWYVDDDNYGKSGLDGTTEATAYGTIQDAIDAATTVDGDTIKVLPGVYSNGVSSAVNARVYLTKGVSLVATSSDPTATKIVGHQDFESGDDCDVYGNGPNAVKCIYVSCSGKTATVQGFTICQGATKINKKDTTSYGGGGVTVAAGTAWVADCVLTGNTAYYRAGAAYGGSFLRCQFLGNNAARRNAEVCYNSVAVFCVFARGEQSVNNATDSCLCRNSTLVNCTIANNANALVDVAKQGGCYNCVFSANRLLSDEFCTNAYATVSSTNMNGEAMLMAAALGDFRPTAGSAADGCGETKYLTTEKPFGDLPEGLELTDMEGEAFDSSSTHVTAGAYLTTVTPAYGGIKVTDGEYVNGVKTYGTNVLYATSWPQFARIRLASNPSAYMFEISYYPRLTPDMNGDIGVCFPRAVGDVRALTLQEKSTACEVPSTSYLTLQAVFASYDKKNLIVANVVAGTHDTGGGFDDRGVTNRISFSTKKYTPYVKYVATNKTVTVVKGGCSSNPSDNEKYPGCGPDAVRCVSFSYDSPYDRTLSFTGMTFKDGRTDCGQSAEYDQGGAAYGNADHVTWLMFVDCDFENCYAPDAGVGVNATFIRCRFKSCGSAGVGFKNCIVSSCVFEDCDFRGGTFGENCITVNCSDPSGNAVGAGDDQVHVNSHFGFGTAMPSDAKDYGCSLWGTFADASNGDLRPTSGSSAVDATRRPFPTDTTSADFTTFAETYAKYAELPYSGDEWLFGGAYPIAGACQDWVRGVSVELTDSSVYTVTRSGESVTIDRKADAVRHYGVVIAGVTNMLDNGSASYTLPADANMTDGAVFGCIDPNWYVNANTDSSKGAVGSDANNGFTAATPKLTLKGVLSVATNVGDIVHAAAGVYDCETMGGLDDAPTIPIRAKVADDVTLVGAGAESTFITGEKTGDAAPVRGIYLGARSRLADFTVCNCAVTNTFSDAGAKTNLISGAAVIAESGKDTVVADCIISNNVAYTAAGTHNVS